MSIAPSTTALTETESSSLLKVALTACDGAKRILDDHFGNLRNVEEKFQAGLVSDADRESEKYIVNQIRAVYPDHAILGEEGGLSGVTGDQGSGFLWMIDPLDGTTNFIHQFPFFCISIGLEVRGELVLGVVDAPKLGMRFHAIKGQGAYLNGERLTVRPRQKFRDGLFATGFSSSDDQLDLQLEIASTMIREARGIRRAGAAALDLCFVAQGVYDAFWERNLSAWDMAAGAVIARETGALVTDMQGEKFDPRNGNILCANPYMHADVLALMNKVRARHQRH